MAPVKICPKCGTAYEIPYPMECPLDLEDLTYVEAVEPIQWAFVSEDGSASLTIKEGNSFDIGREHTLKEYLRRFSMVGRLQARLSVNQGKLEITNLGRTNKIMVDSAIVFEGQTVEAHNGSTVILGRNPDELGGYDDHQNSAFFRIEKLLNE